MYAPAITVLPLSVGKSKITTASISIKSTSICIVTCPLLLPTNRTQRWRLPSPLLLPTDRTQRWLCAPSYGQSVLHIYTVDERGKITVWLLPAHSTDKNCNGCPLNPALLALGTTLIKDGAMPPYRRRVATKPSK